MEPLTAQELIACARATMGKSWERERRPPLSPCPKCGSLEHVEDVVHDDDPAFAMFSSREDGEGESFIRRQCKACNLWWSEYTLEGWTRTGLWVLSAGVPSDVEKGLRRMAMHGPSSTSQILTAALRKIIPRHLLEDPQPTSTDLIHWQVKDEP